MLRSFIFIMILLVLLAFRLIAQSEESSDSVKAHSLSLFDLYESTNILRELLVKGETIQCFEGARNTIDSYTNFPGKERYIGYILSYKAQCLTRLARYESAEIHHLLVDWYANNTSDESLKVSNLINYSNLESDRHNYQASIDHVSSQRVDDPGRSLSILKNNLAKNLMMLGLLAEADSLYAELAAKISIEVPGNGFDLPLFYRNYGMFMHKTNRFDDSYKFLNQSLEEYSKVFQKDHYKVADTHRYLAELLVDMDSLDQAFVHYNELINSFDHKIDRASISDVPSNSLAYETVYLNCLQSYCGFINRIIADIQPFDHLIDKNQIFELIQDAEVRVNRFLQSHPPSESVFVLTQKVRDLFDEGIQLALSLFKENDQYEYFIQAFDWSIRSKAYSLRLESERERMTMNTPDLKILRNQQKELFKKMIEYKDLEVEEWLKTDVDSLETIIQQYDLICDSIGSNIDKNDIQLIQTYTAGSDLIKSSTKWKQSLVNYHFVKDNLVVFILNQGKLEYLNLELPGNFEEKVSDLISILQTENQGYYSNEDVEEYEILACGIYSVLFQPIEQMLKEKKLLILADEYLYGLPFSCLVEKESNGYPFRKFRDLNFLLNKYEIQYWMGTTEMAGNGHLKQKELVFIACPDNEIDKALFVERSLKKELNSSGFFNKDYQNQAIHIASHYTIDHDNPLKSGLVCAHDLQRPFVNLEDILANDYSNSKVFINGCNTGSGEYNSGEGQMSLGLVFGIAGTRDIISHFWMAEDQIVGLLANSFYQNGIPGDYPRQLHKVKLKFLSVCESGYDHPHFWAGMVCASKPQKRQGSGLLVLFIAMTFAVAILAYRSSMH